METLQRQLFPIEEIKTSKHRNRKTYNQYFTPEFAVERAFSFIPGSKIKNIIDPAVGNGVFLKIASKIWEKAELFGIDIDRKVISELNKLGFLNAHLFGSNSLLPKTWKTPKIHKILLDGGFDLVVGNPPFSSWFDRIESKEILSSYQLAYKNGKITRSLGIEILFLEIFINFAKEHGFIVIVLPDGLLSNPQYKYVREFVLKNTKVLRIISLPRNIFEDTSAKTSILILQKMNTGNLKYFAKIIHLEKTGKINNTIKVRAEDLLNRMDYYYHHNLANCSLRKLSENGLVFKPLREFVVYCKTGKTLYGKERKFSKAGLRFLHTTDMGEICINHKKDKKFIEPNSKMDFKSAHTKIGDILIARVGNGCVGRCRIVASKKDIGIVSDCIYIVGVKNISPYFITIFLKTKFGKDWMNLQKHGSATTCISQSNILSLPVPLFNKKIQQVVEKSYKKILYNYRWSLNAKKDISGVLEKLNQLIQYVEKKIEQVTR